MINYALNLKPPDMKKLLLFLPLLMLYNTSMAKKVKFAVDMSGETVSAKGIHVMGDFQADAGFLNNWDADTTVMTKEGSTDIYSVVVDIPAFRKYEYKFVNGDQSTDAEIVPGESRVNAVSNDNRWLYVDSLATDTTYVGALMFGNQTTGAGNAPAGLTLVRFRVNMQNALPISTNGIHVAGSFQGWDTKTSRMYSFGDSVFEYMAYVPAGTYDYKFYNGNTPGTTEIVAAACAVSGNRSIAVSTHSVLDPVCFATCNTCFSLRIDETSKKEALIISPNPASSFTIITSGSSATLYTVSVRDMMGRLVASYTRESGPTLRINLEKLVPGVYNVTLKDSRGNAQTQRLIRQ